MNGLRALSRVALLVGGLLVASCGPTIDEETYERIEVGMTLQQVRDLLGSAGTLETAAGTQISSGGILSGASASQTLSEEVYSWKGSGRNAPEIVVKFKDGQVVSKFKRNF